MSQHFIEIRVPLKFDGTGYDATDPDTYMTFLLYDDTSEEVSRVPASTRDIVVNHVENMLTNGRCVVGAVEDPAS